jgi:uncharacterized protein HemX
MNPYLVIAALIAVLAAGAGGFTLGVDHQKAAEIDKREVVAEAVDAANSVWAAKVSDLKPIYTTIQAKVQHEIETNTVYRDCKLSPDGLQLANQALGGGGSAPGGGQLPQADPAGK